MENNSTVEVNSKPPTSPGDPGQKKQEVTVTHSSLVRHDQKDALLL